jgi:hypothetical protein
VIRRLLREAGPHLSVAFGFALLAIAWTFPLALHLSTHLPGTGIGDNASFFWNFWWMRTARASGAGFFHTPYLLAPNGADLTLHTHTALPAYVGATLLGGLSIAAALNVTTIASLALNGFCAYWLAWRAIRQRGGAILAGIIFASSPYIAARLHGHFNLTAAWTIPLFALGIRDAIRGSAKWAVFSGIVLAATAYIDYYYVVYEAVFACCALLMAMRAWSVELRAWPLRTRWVRTLIGAIAIDVAVIVAIATQGGFAIHVGPLHVSARDPFNPLQLLWALIATALWIGLRPRVRAQRRDDWSPGRTTAGLTIVIAVFLVGAAPLVRNAFHLLVSGQYVTQQYHWRSAPVGIDLLTVLIGNPFHTLWGAPLRHVYARLGIDLIESGAWLGIVPLVLAAIAVRRRFADPIVHYWLAVGGVFFVWALGSHVHAAGYNIGLIGPEVLLRYVPIAANARMPGRAMVIVDLALAMLAATAVATLRPRRSALLVSGLAALVLADSWIAPMPLAPIACPPIYRVLRDRPERGALAELPLGLGDAFGDVTPFDRRTLVCQAIHERPIVGGFVTRLPPSVLAAYRADPLIAAWLLLSGAPAVGSDGEVPDASVAAQRMDRDDIAFVLLNRRTASPALRDYVERVLPLTVVSQDDERTLFVRSPRDRIGG